MNYCYSKKKKKTHRHKLLWTDFLKFTNLFGGLFLSLCNLFSNSDSLFLCVCVARRQEYSISVFFSNPKKSHATPSRMPQDTC